jgi:hypothetical protein
VLAVACKNHFHYHTPPANPQVPPTPKTPQAPAETQVRAPKTPSSGVINVKNCLIYHRPRLNKKSEMDISSRTLLCARAGTGRRSTRSSLGISSLLVRRREEVVYQGYFQGF